MIDVLDVLELLAQVTAPDRVWPGDANDDYSHDEALTGVPQRPLAVVCPTTTAEVAAIARIANEHLIPVTARGSGAGVSGAAIPRHDGIVVSFERMRRVQIDEENMVAVVQPGVTLTELDKVTASHSLLYPVLPGEHSASVGGNIGTNAGGMRAVKYGVTRHNVLGLEMVLASGEIIRSGGKFVKVSTGYDLTQLVIGSEGTLALVTEATLRLHPRPQHQSTVLAPFSGLTELMRAVPQILLAGTDVTTLEYIDAQTMNAIEEEFRLRLGVGAAVRDRTQAYLLIVMDGRHAARLEEEVEELADHVTRLGALEVYVMPPGAGKALIEAREASFWLGKRAGMHDIVDVVVPRASICDFMAAVTRIGAARSAIIAGCGHAGDGNIHLAIHQEDLGQRTAAMRELYQAGLRLGGAISGEHGIGRAKKEHFLALERPEKLDLLRGIKMVFDPNGILNPGVVFDLPAILRNRTSIATKGRSRKDRRMSPVIEVQHLHKNYGATVAVEDVSFTVQQGEIFGILGPNGAGKTTTVECIAGLRAPDRGEISVLGLNPRRDRAELTQRVGVQLQDSQLPDQLRVAEALQLYSSFYRAPADWRALMDMLGLAGKATTKFAKLSGGQKQRLSIALALVGRPQVAILDELTTGLDPQARRDTWELIQGVRAQGVTIVLVTHFMEEAERLCDRVALIDAGRVVELDTPAALTERVATGLRIHFRPSGPLDDELLTQLPEVTNITRTGDFVEITGNADALNAVTSVLAQHQIRAEHLRVEQASLEDAFVALTGGRVAASQNPRD